MIRVARGVLGGSGDALCRGSGGVGASAETSNNGAGSGGGSSGAAAIDEPRIDEPGLETDWEWARNPGKLRGKGEGRPRRRHRAEGKARAESGAIDGRLKKTLSSGTAATETQRRHVCLTRRFGQSGPLRPPSHSVRRLVRPVQVPTRRTVRTLQRIQTARFSPIERSGLSDP